MDRSDFLAPPLVSFNPFPKMMTQQIAPAGAGSSPPIPQTAKKSVGEDKTVDPRAEESLATVENTYGFRPNLIEEMATSLVAAQVYLGGQKALKDPSLSEAEKNPLG